LFVLSAVAAVASVPGRALSQQGLKVADRVPPTVHPFELASVRLLDGPFRDAMLRDQQYLLSLDHDRVLHNFRVNAGLPSSAKPLGGWEAPDVELRGHTLGHYLSACALMYASTGDERFKTRAESVVAELATIQKALAARGFNAGYLSAFPEEFFDRVETRRRVWAPYYTIHKIMAGLLDVHLLCSNQQALELLLKKADWVKLRVDRLSDEQQQRSLETEFGGMNDVLANLYAVTGNPEHLRLARKFDHRAVFDPLARGEDKLNGLHANTQIPKAIGAAREYELTGDRVYQDIAKFFWKRVAHHRSYVIGGNSNGEHFFPVEQFSRNLGASSAETCNTYNMLKLTKRLFGWEPSAELMDFYERALLNHILASQDPATGMMCYYVPLKPGAFKTFSTEDASFWCCVGTGIENHARYGETIYSRDEASLWVNLFIASQVEWNDRGVVLRQETRFPEEDLTRLTLKCEKPISLALRIRYPAWARSGVTVTINGKKEPVQARPGSYIALERQWRDGDRIEVRLPMSLGLEAMPDDPKTVALLYGPVVLAGDLGNEGMEGVRRYGPLSPEARTATPEVPGLVSNLNQVLARVKPVRGEPLNFRTIGIGRPRDVTLKPFNKTFDHRYTVYWKVYSGAEWEKRKAQLAARAALRKQIEQRTIDAVAIGDPQSERDHAFQGERTNTGYLEGRRWRDARSGWFSYELRVKSDQPVVLLCSYWGGDRGRRVFDVLIDGEKVATQELRGEKPGEFFDVEYPLPETLTRGKDRIKVRFQAHADALAGGVFDLRVLSVSGGRVGRSKR
jgi:hypothetical protein